VSSTENFTFSESLSARVETVMVRTGEVSELLSGKEMLVGAVGIENTTGRNFKRVRRNAGER